MEDLVYQCTKCAHRFVCLHKEDYEKVFDAITNINIVYGKDEGVRMTPIRNYDWITIQAPICKHYYYAAPSVR